MLSDEVAFDLRPQGNKKTTTRLWGMGGWQTEGTPHAKVLRQARRAAGVSEKEAGGRGRRESMSASGQAGM